MWPVDAAELERLAATVGLTARLVSGHTDDLARRADVRWQSLVLELADGGAGALPLLRGVIRRQEKAATYKLALLRCIARIADTSPNVARHTEAGIELPLGLIALYWIRMFKPLIEQNLPQRPGERLGFLTDAFRALGSVAAQDLRPGAVFTGTQAEALRRALSETSRLIADMPATHLTFADDRPVFPTVYGRMPQPAGSVAIRQDFLWRYATTQVTPPVWQALRQMSAWIEPMLITEWVRLTPSYAARQGRNLTIDEVTKALRWVEPGRDSALVRSIVLRHLARGESVTCVWSGRKLGAGSVDIDHCLPWSAWPCADLWNLLPAAPIINRHRKRERIVTGLTLTEAKPRIIACWQHAYLADSPTLRTRFTEEARTTLPVAGDGEPELEELFLALNFRRLRLRQESQVAEWNA